MNDWILLLAGIVIIVVGAFIYGAVVSDGHFGKLPPWRGAAAVGLFAVCAFAFIFTTVDSDLHLCSTTTVERRDPSGTILYDETSTECAAPFDITHLAIPFVILAVLVAPAVELSVLGVGAKLPSPQAASDSRRTGEVFFDALRAALSQPERLIALDDLPGDDEADDDG